jgi:hypothetical protein
LQCCFIFSKKDFFTNPWGLIKILNIYRTKDEEYIVKNKNITSMVEFRIDEESCLGLCG